MFGLFKKPPPKDIDKGGEVLDNLRQNVSAGIDQLKAQDIVATAIDALKMQAVELKKADYSKMGKDPAKLAKSMSYTAKVIDEMARLIEFAQGKPDSRPDVGLGSVIKALNDEQLEQVRRWVEENRGKAIQ